jgi:hypothetical protein
MSLMIDPPVVQLPAASLAAGGVSGNHPVKANPAGLAAIFR